MRKYVLFTVIVLLLIIPVNILNTSSNEKGNPILLSIPHHYSVSGPSLDVYEYSQNESLVFSNVHSDTTFTYQSDWYPPTHQAYRLHAAVTNLRKTIDPIPNGDFEQYPEPGNNWTVTQSDGLVSSLSNVSGGNPDSCLDIELAYSKLLNPRLDYIDNDFNFSSQFTPTTRSLSFDIRYSADITIAEWFVIRVEIEDQFNESMGAWTRPTSDFSPTSWTHLSLSTNPVNGSLTLRISLRKTITSNFDVDGHIYFDNFEFHIGSSGTPNEVGLTLNSTAVIDTFGSNGEADIYADSVLREEIVPTQGWNTTQAFTFVATESITFDFQYTMYVKAYSDESASTVFTITPESEPLWIINYAIPSGQPPPGYQGYQFGLYLPDGWNLVVVRDHIENIIDGYSYDTTSHFLLMDKNIGVTGEFFDIHCSIISQAQAILNSPIPNGRYGWGTLPVNVSWINPDAEIFISNALVTLRYTDGNSTFTIDMEPNGFGSYSVEVPVLSSAPESPITLEIEFLKKGYLNATFAMGTALQFAVVVNTGLSSETVVIILAVVLLAILILSWLLYSKVYRQRYVIPKRVAHARILQDVLEVFNDVSNLSRFLVLHRGSGIAIFDPFKDKGMDASLFGGFLQALQAFAIDVASNSDDSALPSEARLSEITYEGFRVIIHDGTYIRTALVYRGIPSDTLKGKIQAFASRFEARYSHQLENRGFEPAIFDEASDLLEEIFHVSLLFPHRVVPEVPKGLSLSVLENRLHFVALELTKESESVFLGEIMNSYKETVQEEPIELMNAIFQLREKDLLIPSEVF